MTFGTGLTMIDYGVLPQSTGIPQLILLTHVDKVCPAVEEDVKYVYSSRTVQDKVVTQLALVSTFTMPFQVLYATENKCFFSNSVLHAKMLELSEQSDFFSGSYLIAYIIS